MCRLPNGSVLLKRKKKWHFIASILVSNIKIHQFPMLRRAFLDQEAPPGYIAGIGRGATGFTTRSDIGNSRLPPQTKTVNSDDEDNFGDVDEKGLLGYSNGLSKEDQEADVIYQEIENRMKSKNKRKLPIDEVEQDESNLTKISNQFVDLKKGLSSITVEQWANLPEVGDLTKRNKRLRQLEQDQQRTYAAPDTLLTGISNGSNIDSSVDIGALTSQREKLLGSKIDANLDIFNNNEEALDSTSYLNEISNLSSNNEEEIKKIKTILSSFTKADPNKPEGWIARARLEEFNKNFEYARKIIQQGCDNCPNDEEIWLENVRLNQHDLKYAKIVIADGVKNNPRSLKLWIKAADLEQESFNKKRVIRKALESLPTSTELWSKSIELEEDKEDQLKIALKSVEIVPEEVTLWLRLINLQTYEEAKKTLNKARKVIPNNILIWLKACHLEAVNGASDDKLEKLVKKTFKECSEPKEVWYEYAINYAKDGMQRLAKLIVENLLSTEDQDYATLLEDAKRYELEVHIYKAILKYAAAIYPKKAAIWRRLIKLYKSDFQEELFKLFEKIVATLPDNATFWLMYSKEVWKINDDIKGAKNILQRAFDVLPSNVDIWLALIKLETVEGHNDEVMRLYKDAKGQVSNERIWYKFVTFLRQQSLVNEALEIASEGAARFPECWKLVLQRYQIYIDINELAKAREVVSVGTKTIPNSVELWIALSEVDYLLGNETRSRSDLDLGILKNAESDKLWLAKLQLEQKLNNKDQIDVILTKALQKFPKSALIWAAKIKSLKKKSARKTAYQDALSATNNDVRILLVIGVNFWTDGKFDKCKRWFERAIEADDDFGDAWAWNYNFLERHKESDEELEEFIKKFQEKEPRHGDVWPVIAKKIENLDIPETEILKLVGQELLRL